MLRLVKCHQNPKSEDLAYGEAEAVVTMCRAWVK